MGASSRVGRHYLLTLVVGSSASCLTVVATVVLLEYA